jgi:hypothetical protein
VRRFARFPFRAVLLPAVVAVVACSSNDNGTLKIVTGEETDVFTAAPAPDTLTVYAIDSSDNWTQIGTGPASTSDIDLGTQDESNAATIAVLGTVTKGADTGTDVVAGFSLALQYGALSGGTLPVFTQRTNEWARLPSPPTDARQSPTLAILGGEFLVIGGGSGSATTGETTQLYDFAPLSPVSGPPTLQVSPLSMPLIGTVALVLGPGATNPEYYDFSDGNTAEVPLPSKQFTWADVAGGQVLYDYDGSSGTLDAVFVVGATRTQGAPTQAVLEIVATDTSNSNYPSGNLKWLSLTTPRLGAAAAYVEGTGLVVIGGNSGGAGDAGTAAGVEEFANGSTGSTFTALSQFPSDPSIGAGATDWLDPQHVLVAGGITPTGQDAGVRVFSLVCMAGAADCIKPWTTLPIPLTAASTYVLSNGGANPALVVGNELVSGLTHTFLINSAKATEVPTKVPHHNASTIQSPLGFGAVLLFGGADEIEQFMPPQSP